MTLQRGQTTAPGEAGFALIEVIVSALIAVTVTGAVIGLLNATGRAGAEERHRSQAYSIAQEDQARLRALRISELNVATKPRTVTLNGTPYTVTSTSTFVSDKTGTTTCGGETVAADYVKLGSTVDWPSLGSRPPVYIESIVSPVSGSLDPSHGNLAITVKTPAGVAISGVGLSGTGPGTFSGSTDSSGCALFGGEPAGNYTLTPSLASEYVDVDGKAPSPESVGITAGSTNTVLLEYGRAGTVLVEFKVKGYNGTVGNSTADSIIVANNGMTTGTAGFGTPGGTPKSVIEAKPLYPFSGSDNIYAGSCIANKPEAGAVNVNVPAGGTTSASVQLPALYVTVKNSSGTPAEQAGLGGATVTASDTKCPETGAPVKRTYTTISPSGQLSDPGLPWSTYNLCASASISGIVRRTKTASPIVVHSLNGTSLTMTLSKNSETGAC
jgi:Tfp pilus assembly protein PilV